MAVSSGEMGPRLCGIVCKPSHSGEHLLRPAGRELPTSVSSDAGYLAGMRLTHFGHACLLVEAAGARILLDPGMFSSGFESLTGLDAVLITHQHPDHVDVERLPALLAANAQAALVTEPQIAEQLRENGLAPEPLRPGEQREFGGLRLRGVGGEHARLYEDDPVIGNVGMLLSAPDEPTFFHPGDAYSAVPDGVDVLALPLAAPWTGGRGTIDFVRAVSPRVAVPIHDGMLAPAGRNLYVSIMSARGPESTHVLDLAGAGPTDV
jgi:L-ascorbate metabolism protein UlaG (beta-lactamase superfamily)